MLPYGLYSYTGQPDSFGGTLSVNASAFNVLRTTGTDTQRAAITGDYSIPFQDGLGEQWSTVFHVDAAAYNATGLNEYPNFDTSAANASEGRVLPQVALNYRWPILNDFGFPRVAALPADRAADRRADRQQQYRQDQYPERGQLRLPVHRREPVRLQQVPRHRPRGERAARQSRVRERVVPWQRRHHRRAHRPVLPREQE